VGKYLKLARKAAVTAKEANTAKVVPIDTSRPKYMTQAHDLSSPAIEIPKESRPRASYKAATKATEATKAPAGVGVRADSPRDISDKRSSSFVPLTVSETLAEMGSWGTGASRNAELYRRGELSEEKAVEYVTCAILARRGASFRGWKRHAPAVRKALSLCVHEIDPKACKVCNSYVRSLIENQGDVARGNVEGGQWT
jgi:hypothetical protein